MPRIPCCAWARCWAARCRRRSWLLPAAGSMALSFLAYLALVLLMWAPHTATTGMPYETEFITSSDTRSLLRAFFYWMDGMRAFT